MTTTTTQMRPFLIQIGDRIVNLSLISFIRFDGPEIVNVTLADGRNEQFSGPEGVALAKALAEFVWKLDLHPTH
jgi:hypothetical protein